MKRIAATELHHVDADSTQCVVWLMKRMTAARCNVPRSDTEKQPADFLSDSNDSMQIVGTTAAEQGLSSFWNNEAARSADLYSTVLYQRAH